MPDYRMKILIVSQYFYPENFRINDLAFALKRRGHEVTVLTGMPNYPAGKLFEGYSWLRNKVENVNGIKVYRVPLFLRRESKGWQLALNYLSFVFSAIFFGLFMLVRMKFDVVFATNYSPATVGLPAIFFRRLKEPLCFSGCRTCGQTV
jgi:hypothetical protein